MELIAIAIFTTVIISWYNFFYLLRKEIMDEGIQRNLPQPVFHPPIPSYLGRVDVIGSNDATFIDSAVMGIEQDDRLQRLSILGEDYRIITMTCNPILTAGKERGRVAVQEIGQSRLVMGVLPVMIAETEGP